MAWDERPYYRDRGYSPNRLTGLLSGSVPLFTIFGIRVRAHAILILFIAGELALNWTPGYDLPGKLVSMAMLLGVVLLHELGHSLAARAVGGWTDEILLWPLGGLTFSEVPHRPGARFLAAASGPATNVVMCAAAAAGVWVLDDHTWVPLNPLRSFLPPPEIGWHNAAFYCWWAFAVSYILLVLNLLPIHPLDGGRMLQATLWTIFGHYSSMVIAGVIGMCGAVALGVYGLVYWNLFVVVLSAWLFYSCYQERVALAEAGPAEPWQEESADFSQSLYRDADTGRRRVNRKTRKLALKRARQDAAERQRLDTILAKVSAEGLQRLTWRERRFLRKATERLRRREVEMKEILGD